MGMYEEHFYLGNLGHRVFQVGIDVYLNIQMHVHIDKTIILYADILFCLMRTQKMYISIFWCSSNLF